MTLGPKTEEKEVIRKLFLSGANVMRLNFSHGAYSQFKKIIKNIREIEKEESQPIGILQDLQGPKIRIGKLSQDITVKRGDKIIFTAKKVESRKQTVEIPIQYKNLGKDVKVGHKLLVDDGLIELRILKITDGYKKIHLEVLNSGVIKSNKGINAPDSIITVHSLTEKDKKDLIFGLKEGVDYVALSFVRDASDIIYLKKLIKKAKSNAKVISKIERSEALENLEEIIKESDAVMIARGDLGLEIPAEKVPLIQKKIIKLVNKYAKPVITATQILASMVDNPRPTRAEISDAANAVLDHTDALMLSNETAVGQYPVSAVKILARTAEEIEKEIQKHVELRGERITEELPVFNATCLNACKLARDIHAKAVITVTRSGLTAQEIAKHRLSIPIIVITGDYEVARGLTLMWGLSTFFIQKLSPWNPKKLVGEVMKKLHFKKGEEAVIVNARDNLITTIVK